MKSTLLLSCLLLIISYSLFAQNIGIGISLPTSRLDVRGNETTGHGKNAAISLTNTASTNIWTIRAGATGTSTPANGFSIGDNSAYRLVINSNGDVGIGVVGPQQNLSVAGGMNIDQNSWNDGTLLNGLRFGTSSGEGIGSRRTVGTNRFGLDFYTDDTHRMTITNDGCIGINVNTPRSLLTIKNGGGSVYYLSGPTEKHAIAIWDSSYNLGSTVMVMGTQNTQNVGYIHVENVGTTGIPMDPRLVLNVHGAATIIGGLPSGNSTIPYKLVVANGDASIEGDLFVNYNKGIIRNTSSAQLKQVITSVQVNGNIPAGTTITQNVVWSQTFATTPVTAYIGNVTALTTGGWAELILSIAFTTTNGCTLYVSNPRGFTIPAGFTFNIIAIGQ